MVARAGRHDLRCGNSARGIGVRNALGMAAPVVLAGGCLALAGCGGGGGESGSDAAGETTPSAATTAPDAAQTAASGDCATLESVMADITVGAHADEVVVPFHDVTAREYEQDRDFIVGYVARAPEAIRADVELLGRWIDHYATTAKANGVAPGVVPTFEQMVAINGGTYMDSLEQDRLLPAIQALGIWASNGCSGERPVIAAPAPVTETETTTETVAEPTDPVAQAAAEADLGDSVDAVTEAVNEVVQARPEGELEFGTASSDSEIRNCRKVRTLSDGALIAPGGWGFACEVWRDGRLRFDGAPAIIDVDGRVATAP
jgi:hypothetical protein